MLAPWWAERARAVLPPALPVLAFPRLAGEDLPGLRRLWVLALPAAPGGVGDAARDLRGRAGVPGPTTRFGGLAVTPFSLAEPVLPLAFLPDRLAGTPGVARAVREVEYLPRECLVVKPAPGAPPLRVTFDDVPLGRTLRGLAGEEPVRVAVDLDGAGVAEVEEPAAAPGWHAFEIDTSSHAGRAARVTFTISTDDPGPRPLCLDAYTLP